MRTSGTKLGSDINTAAKDVTTSITAASNAAGTLKTDAAAANTSAQTVAGTLNVLGTSGTQGSVLKTAAREFKHIQRYGSKDIGEI